MNLKNYDEVNSAMKKLAELEYQKSRLDADKNLKINSIEQIYSQEAEPIAKQIQEITSCILEFAQKNKDDFEKTKTKKLPNGNISCRTSSVLCIADEGKTIELIRKFKLDYCIKQSESLNKDVVKTLSQENLKDIGVEIIKEHKFSVKTNSSEIKTVANA